jgi:hypothetical protein
MKRSRLYFVGLFLILLLAACSQPSSISTQGLIPTSEQNTGYPAPQGNITESPSYPVPEFSITENPSYPAPETPMITNPSPTFTVDPQLGLVRGRLLRNNVPIPDVVLDLAEVMKDNTGKDIIAGLDRTKSPNATTDNQGTFVFINVITGRYALILDIITNQFLLNYPGSEDSIIMQVEAGKEVNLGDLNFDDLPVP